MLTKGSPAVPLRAHAPSSPSPYSWPRPSCGVRPAGWRLQAHGQAGPDDVQLLSQVQEKHGLQVADRGRQGPPWAGGNRTGPGRVGVAQAPGVLRSSPQEHLRLPSSPAWAKSRKVGGRGPPCCHLTEWCFWGNPGEGQHVPGGARALCRTHSRAARSPAAAARGRASAPATRQARPVCPSVLQGPGQGGRVVPDLLQQRLGGQAEAPPLGWSPVPEPTLLLPEAATVLTSSRERRPALATTPACPRVPSPALPTPTPHLPLRELPPPPPGSA